MALEACADGERVTVAGVVTHRQHPETARGAVFVNLEDETGHVNVVFSRGAWARWKHVARHAPVLLIRGRVRKGQGAVSFDAERVEALVRGDGGAGEPGLPLGRSGSVPMVLQRSFHPVCVRSSR